MMHVPRPQLRSLFIIALPMAAIAWTVTQEELFREFNERSLNSSEKCRQIYQCKFFYVFSYDFRFSHCVTAAFLILTRYGLLFSDWRGCLFGGFAWVSLANDYMAIFGRLRVDLKRELRSPC
jgi:hypothetical protein